MELGVPMRTLIVKLMLIVMLLLIGMLILIAMLIVAVMLVVLLLPELGRGLDWGRVCVRVR